MKISRRFITSLLASAVWWFGVAISAVLYLFAAGIAENKAVAEFDYQANNAQLAIQARMQSYIDVLRGVSALFYTSNDITREQFHAYVKELHVENSFPGITNLNFARRIFASEKSAYARAVKSDSSLNGRGYPDFSVTPTGERNEYHVLTYLEPMESNLVSFGFDIASNKAVAHALAASRDSGQLNSSGRLIRISGPYRHIGLAMRMPLYRRDMPIDSVDARRAAYYGSVGAGFDISKLMLGIIDKKTLSHIRLYLYDIGPVNEPTYAGTSDPEHLLFEGGAVTKGHAAAFIPSMSGGSVVKRVSMQVGSRKWEAEFSANKSAMLEGFDAYFPMLVLIAGLVASLLLYSVYYSLMSARRRAVELAREMTKDLRASKASLAEAQHMAHLGSWLLNPHSGKMKWSEETYRILGIDRVPGYPQYEDFLRCIHQHDRASTQAGLELSINTGEEYVSEHRITQGDGSMRWVHTICRPGSNDGKVMLRGTIMDVTERKLTVEALKRSQDLLRDLTVHQDRVKEDERKRIAREIHDELGQTLLALRIDVSMLEARTGKSHPRLNEKVRGALQHIDATVKTIRTIINNLRPAVLDLGLSAAIEWQVKEFRRRSGIECELVLEENEFAVDDERATTLFRVLQESLTNVIRHANATRVVVELFRDDDRLVMKISDNGIGIYEADLRTSNSFGLVGVEERIHALNGEFLIDSAPGRGTSLMIFIPIERTRMPDYSMIV